jgi:hypothetical protein
VPHRTFVLTVLNVWNAIKLCVRTSWGGIITCTGNEQQWCNCRSLRKAWRIHIIKFINLASPFLGRHLGPLSYFVKLPVAAITGVVCCCDPKPKLYYDRRSVGQSVLVSGTHLGTATKFSPLSKIIFRQLWVCWSGAPSLTRGRVCSFQLLLGLVSAVFLGFESRGTHDRILLPQF